MTNSTAGLPTASQIKPNGHIAYVEAEGFTTFEDQHILQSAPVTVASPASQTHNPVIRSAFKIFGMLCLACSIAEMGIGSFAYQYIKGAGAFWSVIMGVIAGSDCQYLLSVRIAGASNHEIMTVVTTEEYSTNTTLLTFTTALRQV